MELGAIGIFFHDALSLRWQSVGDSLVGAAFPCLTIWFIGWLYEKLRHKEGLGLGDVKMIAMIGAFMGLRGALLTLILGSVVGAVCGIVYVWWTKKDMGSYELPFGSFLGVAAFGISVWDAISSLMH